MKHKFTYCVAKLVRFLSLRPRPYTTAVLLAGGEGRRMGNTGGVAKQWLKVGGKTLMEHSLLAFEACPHIDEIVVVVRRGEGAAVAEMLSAMEVKKVKKVVSGGQSRQASAYRGVRRVSDKTRFVAIHDVVRCLISPEDISSVVLTAYSERAASLGVAVNDTVKRVDKHRYIRETKDRKEFFLAATPQVFALPLYLGAAKAAIKAGHTVTDDNMLMEYIGQRVRMVEAKGEVMKITTPADLERAEAYLAYRNAREARENV